MGYAKPTDGVGRCLKMSVRNLRKVRFKIMPLLRNDSHKTGTKISVF